MVEVSVQFQSSFSFLLKFTLLECLTLFGRSFGHISTVTSHVFDTVSVLEPTNGAKVQPLFQSWFDLCLPWTVRIFMEFLRYQKTIVLFDCATSLCLSNEIPERCHRYHLFDFPFFPSPVFPDGISSSWAGKMSRF